MKLVTVLLPVYNGSKYLREAIESILAQTFSDFEFIIINDASTDDSENIILSYYDSRIRYYKNEINLGLVATLNKGLVLAEGKYIARMDQDDWSYNNRLQMQYEFMESNPAYCVIGSHISLFNSQKKIYYPLTDSSVKQNLLWSPSFAHPAVMIRSSVIKEHQLFYDDLYTHAEDYGFWVKLSQYGKMANLNKILLKYRFHENQYTSVYKESMKLAGRNARLHYYDLIPAKWNPEEKELFIRLVDMNINFSSIIECKNSGTLLLKFKKIFQQCDFDVNQLLKTSGYLWKEICLNRQKKGYDSFFLFFTNILFIKSSWRIQAWFIKEKLKMSIFIKKGKN